MNIQIISDLHQEFGYADLNFSNADIIVLAGDVNIGIKGIDWILKNIQNKPVIYILGNHEYYKGSYPKTLNKIKALAENSNVFVLENDSVEFDGIVFHGATLWTDFSIFGNPRLYGMLCQESMNDYKKIRVDPSYSRLRSIDTFRIHSKSMIWLRESLECNIDKTNIVVTHHAPSIKSIPEEYKNDSVSSAYASNLEDFIHEFEPRFWIHGHIHQPMNYKIGNTEIICNPHGYIDEAYNGFEKELILEI
ncbi:metallophosphoesterase [Aureibacter tunicatorum]|uniref:Icc-related predicted phosphoesterase n=1 Tax=Aureibacter tunicatorum TaxID=866807 RepID=A0AAE3XJ08_9BACT|nr:metallophosphoesterase [Aureibacter tunicatorum]MDR6237305.1 Icc-related predicted phosphoesterase [Aureibacter tunicatorum]BDD06296.1 phosphatase [Aureibacter tunicatorum]